MNPWTTLVGPILIVLVAAFVGRFVMNGLMDYRYVRQAHEMELEAMRWQNEMELESIRSENRGEWADEWEEFIESLPELRDDDERYSI